MGGGQSKHQQDLIKSALKIFGYADVEDTRNIEIFNDKELRLRYRRLAYMYHPDNTDGSHDKWMELNQAYGVLISLFEKKYGEAPIKDFEELIFPQKLAKGYDEGKILARTHDELKEDQLAVTYDELKEDQHDSKASNDNKNPENINSNKPSSNKHPSLGIDLGNDYCCIGTWRNNAVEMIPNNMGEKMIPSCIAFTESEILIGTAARNQAVANPANTIYDIMRLIGKKFSSVII